MTASTDTFSGTLPSLPAIPRDGGHLDELDPRFPIRLTQPASIFWQLTQEWDDRETVISQTIRATQQHTNHEERFVQPLPRQTVGSAAAAWRSEGPDPAYYDPLFPAKPEALPPAPYQQLDEDTLTHEWNAGPGTAILAAPTRHRRRGPGGRFIAREVTP